MYKIIFQRNNDDGMAEDEDNEDGLMGNPQMQLNGINGAPIQFPPGLLNQANMGNMMNLGNMGNLPNIGVPGMGQFNPLAALAAVDLHQAAQEQLAQNNADAQQQQNQQQQDSDNDMV